MFAPMTAMRQRSSPDRHKRLAESSHYGQKLQTNSLREKKGCANEYEI